MQLDDVYRILEDTDPDAHWHRADTDYATFLNNPVEGERGLEFESHFGRAAFKADIALGLAWGLPYDGGRTWEEDWAHFPDRSIRGYWADIFYAGMLIERHLLLSVDGGRCFLPAPTPIVDDSDLSNVKVLGQEVDRIQHNLARIIDGLRGGVSEYDSYFRQSGIQLRG